MKKFKEGHNYLTLFDYNSENGMTIPKGSVVTVKFDDGQTCFCSFYGNDAWYRYEWLGVEVTDSDEKNNSVKQSFMDGYHKGIEEFADWCYMNGISFDYMQRGGHHIDYCKLIIDKYYGEKSK